MATSVAAAAKCLGVSEEVIYSFLHLVVSVQKNSCSVDNAGESADHIHQLIDEYDRKL